MAYRSQTCEGLFCCTQAVTPAARGFVTYTTSTFASPINQSILPTPPQCGVVSHTAASRTRARAAVNRGRRTLQKCGSWRQQKGVIYGGQIIL